MGQNLLKVADLSNSCIEEILNRARFFADNQDVLGMKDLPYQDRFVANLFLEPSTRTRFSFEVAEKKLGAHPINFESGSSSLQKGESLLDTLRTLEAMGVEVAVIRLREEGLLEPLTKKLNIRIINAGEGKNEHPSQALLDLYTIKSYFKEIKGLNVAIIGDIAHSRVARSNYHLLKKMGANIFFSGPNDLMPKDLAGTHLPINDAIANADVVMMLRVQYERLEQKLSLSQEEYNLEYGFTKGRLKLLQPHAIILHPAPVNRGVEMDDFVVEHSQTKVFEQIKNGVWIRMAIIERALGGNKKWGLSSNKEKYGMKIVGL